MLKVIKLVRVVIYREELTPISLHDSFTTQSWDFDFLLYDL